MAAPPLSRCCCGTGEAGRGLTFLHCLSNRLYHCFNVLMHFGIGKAQHAILLLLVRPKRALSVILDLIGVRIAIDFDDQLRLGAEEIHDVSADGVLPPKLRAVDLPAA